MPVMKTLAAACALTSLATASLAASYEPVPKGWSRKIDLPGQLLVGSEYRTQDGKCSFVGSDQPDAILTTGTRIPFFQACQMNQRAAPFVAARVPVQVLAKSPAGSVIVRLKGKNYGTSTNGLLIQDGDRLIHMNEFLYCPGDKSVPTW